MISQADQPLSIEALLLDAETDLVVEGLRLRPFSLGHLVKLDEIDFDPEFSEPRNWPAMVMLAVLVCQKKWAELREMEDASVFNREYRMVEKAILKSDIIPQKNRIYLYIKNAIRWPAYTKENTKGESRESGQPWFQLMKTTLMRYYSMSETDVMDRPLLASICDWFSALENEDQINMDSQTSIDETAEMLEKFSAMSPEELQKRFERSGE